MEGVPITVLRGHDRLVSSICTVNDNLIFSADELGNLLAWKRKLNLNTDNLEYELLTQIHLESSSIATVTTQIVSETLIHIFIQIKSGEILRYKFDGMNFIEMSDKRISCGTFTFCRMSSLDAGIETEIEASKDMNCLLAYPSEEQENAINLLNLNVEGDNGSSYIFKNFMVQSSGMCLFTKLKRFDSKLLLICGYESGKLVILDILNNCEYKIIFEDKVLNESCTDADLHDDTLVIVGASKAIKIIKSVFNDPKHISIDLPFAGCNSICIRSDGKLFVTGGWDCKLRFFSLKTGKLLAVLDHHFEAISDVKIIKIEDKFVTIASSSDGTISLWTLYS